MQVYQKFGKRLIDIFLAFFGLILGGPIFLLIAFLIKIDSRGPIIFRQKRVGKNGQIFTMYKFRTMVEKAEQLKKTYLFLNEADGPVFKIKNDPRLTKIGKILTKTGLDELPQLVNILKGEMSLVGPRPLPVDEERKIPARYQARRLVKPGIFSPWTASGASHDNFYKWMESDIEYANAYSFFEDLKVVFKTLGMLLK